MTNKDFYPYQIWCCNSELYERDEADMGMSKSFANPTAAKMFYEDCWKNLGGKVTFEFRLYDSPSSYKGL